MNKVNIFLISIITSSVIFLVSCSEESTATGQLHENEVFKKGDTITMTEVTKHVMSICGVSKMKSMFGDAKVKDIDKKIIEGLRQEGSAAVERSYSFLTDEQEDQVKFLVGDKELKFDTAFVLSSIYSNKTDTKGLIIMTSNSKSLIDMSKPYIISINNKGKINSASTIWKDAGMSMSYSMNTVNDTLITTGEELILLVQNNKVEECTAKIKEWAYSTNGDYTKPEWKKRKIIEFGKRNWVFTIDDSGKINRKK